jgi:hypothetical protein
MTRFGDALWCEWRKRRRSHAAWLVVIGALFTPTLVLTVRLLHPQQLAAVYAAPGFWPSLWRSSWESMAIFFLPMAAILATSLIVQIEVRNNAWKQVHALPLSAGTIYAAKLTVIVAMIAQFLGLFVVGVVLSGLLPPLLRFADVPFPAGPPPLAAFAGDAAHYFIDGLPIIAAQYLLCVRFHSFLAPIGIGFLAWVGALAALSWPPVRFLPYAYPMLDYLKEQPGARAVTVVAHLPVYALAWFVILAAVGYGIFVGRSSRD